MFRGRSQAEREADFADLVHEHQAMVYSIGLHLLRDAALAEELAQEVFLKLFENWGAFESREHVKNWLRRVMVRRVIDHTRRAKLRPCPGLGSAPEPRVPVYEPDILASEHLELLVARLPERARQIVALRYQEDLEPAEIAQLLGLSVGAVKSTLHRSLLWLRTRMERAGVTK